MALVCVMFCVINARLFCVINARLDPSACRRCHDAMTLPNMSQPFSHCSPRFSQKHRWHRKPFARILDRARLLWPGSTGETLTKWQKRTCHWRNVMPELRIPVVSDAIFRLLGTSPNDSQCTTMLGCWCRPEGSWRMFLRHVIYVADHESTWTRGTCDLVHCESIVRVQVEV